MPRNNLSLPVVVQAATKIADAEGLRQLSIKKLAEALDVKPPALYNHVGSFADLQVELTMQGLVLLRDALAKASIGKAGHDALRAAGAAYVEFAKAHPGLYEATQWVNVWQGDARVMAASEEVLAVMDCIFASYHFDEIKRTNIIRAFRSLCHGFASLEVSHGFGNPVVDVKTSFAVAMDMLLAGMDSLYNDEKGT